MEGWLRKNLIKLGIEYRYKKTYTVYGKIALWFFHSRKHIPLKDIKSLKYGSGDKMQGEGRLGKGNIGRSIISTPLSWTIGSRNERYFLRLSSPRLTVFRYVPKCLSLESSSDLH